MTDIISKTLRRKTPIADPALPGVSPAAVTVRCAAPSDPELMALVELFFFAYRDFTGEADTVLAEFGLGRAHHRVLHFVNRRPGLRVADLLDLLKVTKQSLARVLKTLVDDGWIEQVSGIDDRRERRLYLTPRGAALADRLGQLQMRRVAAALASCGDSSTGSVKDFLCAMIGERSRPAAAEDIPAPTPCKPVR